MNLTKMFKAIQGVFSNISKDNFASNTVEGSTASSANASKTFRHGFNQIPSFWIVLEGRAYVQPGSVTESVMDIRSDHSSESFKILIVK